MKKIIEKKIVKEESDLLKMDIKKTAYQLLNANDNTGFPLPEGFFMEIYLSVHIQHEQESGFLL